MTTQRRAINLHGDSVPLLPLTQNDITKINSSMGLMEKWRERKAKLKKGEAQMNGHVSTHNKTCLEVENVYSQSIKCGNKTESIFSSESFQFYCARCYTFERKHNF